MNTTTQTEATRARMSSRLLRHAVGLGLLLICVPVLTQEALFPGALYKAGPSPNSVAMGDVNGDDALDMITTNSDTGGLNGGISILLGNGNGSFIAPTTLWYPPDDNTSAITPHIVAILDADIDGDLDIVTANLKITSYEDKTISLLLGDGKGGYDMQAKQDYLVGANPLALALGDLDNDGAIDLVTANVGYQPDGSIISVLLSDGAGGFITPTKRDYIVDGDLFALTLGDMNNDGALDIVMSDNVGTCNISFMLGDGNGGFIVPAAPAYDLGYCAHSISLGDLNHDGALDLVGMSHRQLTNTPENIDVLLGNGKGGFTSRQNYQTPEVGDSSVLIDMNGDKNLDFVTVQNAYHSTIVMLGDGAGGLETPVRKFNAPHNIRSFTLGDVDGDNNPDLVTVSENYAGVIRGDGAGGFINSRDYTEENSTPALEIDDTSIAVADVNRDGYPDLVRVHSLPVSLTNSVSIMLGNGAGEFVPTATEYTVDNTPYVIALGDVNGDSGIDIVTANTDANSIGVLLGNGTGSFAPPPVQDYTVGDGPSSIALGYLDSDSDLDLVTANQSANTVSVLLWEDINGFVAPSIRDYGVGDLPKSVALGDLNSDGDLDLVTANCFANSFSILLGDGAGSFATPLAPAPRNHAVGECPYDIALGDIDNDSDLDVVTANNGSHLFGMYDGGSVSVLLGDGTGKFTSPLISYYIVIGNPTSIALGDVNGNGNLDIVTSGEHFGGNAINILLGDGAGSFVEPSPWGYLAGYAPAHLGDLNGGGLDIVTRRLVLLQDDALQKNAAPIAKNSTLTTDVNSYTDINFVVTDADGDSLSYIVSKPQHGKVYTVLHATGVDYSYAPDKGYSGTDSFHFQASDGTAQSNTATVAITIKSAADTGGSGGGSTSLWMLAWLLGTGLLRRRHC